MYNFLSKRIPDNRFTRKYLQDFPKMAAEYHAKPIYALPYSLFKLYHENGNRVQYETYYFEIRKRCDVFAAMILSGYPEYITDLQDVLCAICEEYTWALPAHVPKEHTIEQEVTRIDLFAAETAMMLSEIWYLCQDQFDHEINSRIIYELRRRIVNPYLNCPTKWGKNNWSSVCAHGVIMTFIYLGLDQEFKRACPELMDSLEYFLSSYQEDGCSTEGALYWSYGFENFVYAASLLREYTNGEIDYFKSEKVHSIAKYGFYTYFCDNLTLPFSDSPHQLNYNIGLYHFLKKEYPELPLPSENRAAMFGDETRCRFFEMIRNLYWFDESLKGQDTPIERFDFPASQVFIRNRKKYHFACKGGHNNEPHNHNDIGSFVFVYDSKYILDDPGWCEYEKNYASEKRYTDFICAMSAGHSVPIINGQGQVFGQEQKGEIIHLSDTYIELDISNAYKLPGIQAKRSWRLTDDFVEMRDCFSGTSTVIERIVTRIEPQIDETGTVNIQDVTLESNAGKPKISSCSFVPRSVSHIGMKSIETLYMIDYSLNKDIFVLHVVPLKDTPKT